MWLLAMLLEGVRIKKVTGQKGHDSFMPRWVQNTWVQIAVLEDEGT